MRGQILTFDADTGGGLISGDDGNRYAFSALDVIGQVPAVGSTADFVPVDGYAREVVALAPTFAAAVAGTTTSSVDYSGEDLSLWGYFVRAITTRYASGNGRARRKEFWGFNLFVYLSASLLTVVGLIAAAIIDPALESEASAAVGAITFNVVVLWIVALIVPSITILIRRLHDVGMSGWLVLLSLLPFGGIFLFVVSLMPSQQQTNQYGPIPTPRPPSSI